MIDGYNNLIGGTGAEEANTIAYNTSGITIAANPGNTGNAIISNAIFGNTNLGIDLGGDGRTTNDAGDGDSGANDLQNYPMISAVNGSTIDWSLNSLPGATFTVQFFSSPTCSPMDNGEGVTFVGEVVVATDGSGYYATATTVAPDLTGQWITATASSGTIAGGNTSEFSQCYQEGP